MEDPTRLAIYGSLLTAGLAGSLHCVGMCGPILLGFSGVVDGAAPRRFGFLWYHLGRLWTYGLLGLLAGIAGHALRHGSLEFGLQRIAAVSIGIAVIVVGVLLLGLIPRLSLALQGGGCATRRLRGWSWFESLLQSRGAIARLLLGSVMGLLPCGLVYAMLVVVAALPTPLESALGMFAFGLGTLPALSAVLLFRGLLPTWLRAHGTRIVAVTLIITGCLMTARGLMVSPSTACPLHGEPAARVELPEAKP